MVVVTARKALDMTKLNFGKLLDGKHAYYSDHTMRVDNITTHQRDRFNGAFKANTAQKTITGTADEWVRTNYNSNKLIFKFEKMKMDAASVLKAAKTHTLKDDKAIIESTLSKNDKIIGSKFVDRLYGYAGNDTIQSGDGIDWLDGGTGKHDRVDLENSKKSLEVTLNGSKYVAVKANGDLFDHIRSIEDVATGSGNDKVTGDGLANLLVGNSGNDTLDGGKGRDLLRGGNGEDSLVGGAGNDTLEGGNQSDSLNAGGNNDSVSGGSYGDTLSGGTGNDLLSGDNGDDILLGGKNSDTLLGGQGKDLLTGGGGKDVLTGGTEADTFVFLTVGDSTASAKGRDFITDFKHKLDKIDLSAIDAATSLIPLIDDAFTFDKKKMVSPTAAVAEGHIGYYTVNLAGTANDRTFIVINNDGDAAYEMTIELQGAMKLTAGDFIL